MHAKTDSEVTSDAPSSPRRPVYYVQSPSRESHDGEKTVSFHSTPILSPAGSPQHSNSSIGRHSRESSSTRFSGSLKPGAGSRKVNPNDASSKWKKRWNKEVDVIEEEGLLEGGDTQKGWPRRYYVLAFIVGFFVLFSFFSLVLWGASKSQKPRITMQSITFRRFQIQSGSDSSGVATDMISVNSTVRMLYRNTGTFFGVHVTSSAVDLIYSQQLAVASGSIKNFYQSRSSRRVVLIPVTGSMIPLYGSMSVTNPKDKTAQLVPLALNLTVRSRAYVLGKLVKPKFYKTIGCDLVFDSSKLNSPISLKNKCVYV